jgi:hypothetical protein
VSRCCLRTLLSIVTFAVCCALRNAALAHHIPSACCRSLAQFGFPTRSLTPRLFSLSWVDLLFGGKAMLGFKSEFRAVMRCRTQTGNIIPCVMSLRYQW